MASQGPMVVSAGSLSIEIKARRRLKEEGAWEALMDDLQKKISQMSTSSHASATPTISDLDISQNHVTPEQLETLLATVSSSSVPVRRFRLFGIPTLNDEAMRILSDHLRSLTKETAPHEMHLSDCAITSEGFYHLMSAIEETDLYPSSAGGQKLVPLYLRLENNFIAEAALEEMEQKGVLRRHQKKMGARSVDSSSWIKVDMIVHETGGWKQKQGGPPAPEDAPPPKLVHDKYNDPQQGGKGNSWGGYSGSWQNSQAANWQQWGPWAAMASDTWHNNHPWQQARPGVQALPSAGAARPAPMAQGQHQAGQVRPQYAAGVQPVRQAGSVQPRPQAQAWGRQQTQAAPQQTHGYGAQQAQGYGANRGYGAQQQTMGNAARGGHMGNMGAADRSRTPAGRAGGAAPRPTPPAAPPSSSLPHPWEEHFSEEYNIPYFWNSETGESLWEKPT